MSGKQNKQKISAWQIAKQFWAGMKGYRWMYVFSNTLFFISLVALVLIPIFFKKFFDLLTIGEKSPVVASGLLKILLIVLALRFLNWILWRIGIYFYNRMQSSVITKLKQYAFEYMMRHSYTFFANNFSGGLVQKVNRFSRSFETITDTIAFNFISLGLTITGAIITTWLIQPLYSVLITIWVGIFATFSIIFSRWKIKYDIESSEADSKTSGYLSDAITNNNAISFFNGYTFEFEGFKEVTNDQARKMRKSWTMSEITDAVQTFLVFCIEFLIFYFGIKYWLIGKITLGTFVLVQTYVVTLSGQLFGLSRLIRSVYQSLADSKEMVDILNKPYEIQDMPDAKDLVVKEGKIEFKNMTFAFNKERDILKDINLVIKPGEKIAVVGPSGAGKTTFVRLIMRLYDYTSGQILVDGQDIKEVRQDSLRDSISLVPQDPVLFHRTLKENIRYGKRDATDEEVLVASRLAHCDDFIDKLSLKYETYVGERGIKLSGGERQRIAIARAILKKAPILILDEATSSLDSESESLIQDALSNLMKNCTTIVIAHRLSTIKMMDRIIVINDGQIVENGTHEQLLANKDGIYSKLWGLQVGGFIHE